MLLLGGLTKHRRDKHSPYQAHTKMKLFITALLLNAARAQSPVRLRAFKSDERVLNLNDYDASVDDEEWSVESEFGRLAFVLTSSESLSFSMPTMQPTEEGDESQTALPTPSPSSVEPTYEPSTLTDSPTTESIPTAAPIVTSAPTKSKSGKEPKPTTQELFAYSWNLPDEYTGYFKLYKKNMILIKTVELGKGTSGGDSMYLPQNEYTVIVVNKDQSIGYCCNGSEPGYIKFTYGGIEYNEKKGSFGTTKSKNEFVAEFHKNAKKIEVDEDGASYVFDFKL